MEIKSYKIFVLACTVVFLGGGCVQAATQGIRGIQEQEQLVTVKYRYSQVNLANSKFEHLNTTGSSFIEGAWYDPTNDYMIIQLSGTYYHYCDMPNKVWEDFSKIPVAIKTRVSFDPTTGRYSEGPITTNDGKALSNTHSFGTFYQARIKDSYDCRGSKIPTY